MSFHQILCNFNKNVSNINTNFENDFIVFLPHEPFESSEEIELTLDGLEDDGGNLVVPSIAFTTQEGLDFDGPGFVTISPSRSTSETNGLPVNTGVTFRFDEPIIPFEDVPGGANVNFTGGSPSRDVEHTIEVHDDNQGITIIPNQALQPNTSYRASVFPFDYSFNRGGSFSSTLNSSFTTGVNEDLTPPEVLEMSIGDGYQGVPRDAQLILQIDEIIMPSFLDGVVLLNGNTNVPLTTRVLQEENTQIFVAPVALLDPNTEYTVRVEGIRDLSNNIPVIAFERSFTTGSEGQILRGQEMSIVESSIVNNQRDVATTETQLTFQFDRRLGLHSKFSLEVSDLSAFEDLPFSAQIVNEDTLVIDIEENFTPGNIVEIDFREVEGLSGENSNDRVRFFVADE